MNPPSASLISAGGRASVLAHLQSATQEVFDLMLASPLEVSAELPHQTPLEITSMVGLAGPFSAVLTLRCSTKSAARMASRMLGIDAGKASPEMWDAIGEICNMVAGNFKNKVYGLGDRCLLSVPTVITGADYKFLSIAGDDLHVTFLFDGEPIVLSLEVHP
jgi:chemotaxis protein CheX